MLPTTRKSNIVKMELSETSIPLLELSNQYSTA